MTQDDASGDKRMRLRYAGVCRLCDAELPVRTVAVYERTTKTVRCSACPGDSAESDVLEFVIDPGTPGASARREYERRKVKREERIRTKHPKLGGLILALSEDPHSTRSWDVGAIGEEQVGGRLNELSSDSLRVLHDRGIPGSRANIDHLVVAATGVYVIDPKRYQGRPSLKVERGLLRPRVEKLLVGSRDCTKLVDGVLKQVEVVRRVVGDAVSVHGVLCFVDADWPLLGAGFTTRGVDVVRPRKLYPRLQADGELSIDSIAEIHRRLALTLPGA